MAEESRNWPSLKPQDAVPVQRETRKMKAKLGFTREMTRWDPKIQ